FGYMVDEFAERARAQTVLNLTWGIEQGIFHPDLDVELASLAISGAYDRVARALVKMEKKPELRRWLAGLQHLILGGGVSDTSLVIVDGRVKERRDGARRRPRPRGHKGK